MTAAFTADIDHFVAARGLDLVRFAKGRRKDEVTAGYLRRAGLDDRGLVPAQVLYAGVAQEKQRYLLSPLFLTAAMPLWSLARIG